MNIFKYESETQTIHLKRLYVGCFCFSFFFFSFLEVFQKWQKRKNVVVELVPQHINNSVQIAELKMLVSKDF